MRIAPVAPAHRPSTAANRRSPFIADLRLSATILGMISTNSLAAFTQSVSQNAGITPVRGPDRAAPRVSPISPLGSGLNAGLGAAGQSQQRTLDALPPPPSTPLPRGSLLDLRV